MLRRQTPTDFYARRVMRLNLRNLQANEPYERAISPKLRCPKAESVLFEMSVDSVKHGIALFLRKRPSKELHHTSVGIYTGERLPVGVAPRAQGEALGGDLHLVHGHHTYPFTPLQSINLTWARLRADARPPP
jgi:hypothetical protein